MSVSPDSYTITEPGTEQETLHAGSTSYWLSANPLGWVSEQDGSRDLPTVAEAIAAVPAARDYILARTEGHLKRAAIRRQAEGGPQEPIVNLMVELEAARNQS